MDKTVFTLKPKSNTCDCIICRETGKENSDEHIIPKALGGYMHTWNVCKECNSRLGEKVDSLLTQHDFIALQRHLHNLRGQSGHHPRTILEGTFKAEDGGKYKIEYRAGKFEAHMLPTFSEEDGRLTLSLDPRDIKKADKMIQEYCDRRKYKIIPSEKSISGVRETPAPAVNIRMQIDLIRFKLPIVKIAYEFTASLLPDLIPDQTMTIVSEILHTAEIGRLNELTYVGNGFEDIAPKIFGEFIDFSNPKRHYIFLVNLDNGLYCCVKLFNTFFLGVKLSDKKYESLLLPIIAINDFEHSEILLYDINELVTTVNSYIGISFIYKGSTDETDRFPEPVMFGADGKPLLFLTPQICVGSLSQIMDTMSESEISTSISDGMAVTTYKLNGRLGFLTKTNGLLPIDQVISRSQITKI